MATTPTPYYSSEFGARIPVTPLLPEERNDVVEGQGHAKTRSCAYRLTSNSIHVLVSIYVGRYYCVSVL